MMDCLVDAGKYGSYRELESIISIGIHLGCRFPEIPFLGLSAPHEAELAYAPCKLT